MNSGFIGGLLKQIKPDFTNLYHKLSRRQRPVRKCRPTLQDPLETIHQGYLRQDGAARGLFKRRANRKISNRRNTSYL